MNITAKPYFILIFIKGHEHGEKERDEKNQI